MQQLRDKTGYEHSSGTLEPEVQIPVLYKPLTSSAPWA